MAKNSATRDTDFYTRSTMGFISSFYLISRKARFSQVLFIIVTSEKRSRCRRTYRPVCRSTQWVNLRKTRARSREGRARKISRSVWHTSYKSKSISTGRINTSVFFFSQCAILLYLANVSSVTCCAPPFTLHNFATHFDSIFSGHKS